MICEKEMKSWVTGNCSSKLHLIHQKAVNIAIYDRPIHHLSKEAESLCEDGIEIRASGSIESIRETLIEKLNRFPAIQKDISELLELFKELTGAVQYRLFLATVKNNMCRKFHTDINDLRLLCTYIGEGTLWLEEDNVDRAALNSRDHNESIVINENQIRQASTGSVVILKGAIYDAEGTKAIVHRSPTIEESGEHRLLLRIDTDQFLNFDR